MALGTLTAEVALLDIFLGIVPCAAGVGHEYGKHEAGAEAAYKQALADVGVNKAAVENARIRLAYTKVTSPISGRSGRSLVTPGALVTENQSSPLTTVQQLDPVYVDVTQSSTEVLRLKRSLEDGTLQRADQDHAAVRLLLEDGSEYGLTGTLQFADVSVDESTGMVTLRAIFPNPKQELLPGMYVRAILNEGVDDQAILLPQRALLRDAKGNPTTYVVNAENKVEIRPLKVGRTQGNSWVVLDGLKAGDKVIVEGLNMVTKHVKPRRQGEQGGIVKAEGAIYACKVMPVCPKCGKATRVGHSVKDGKTVRVCRKCGAEL